MLVAIGFLMLLLTSLQGWGMVALIATDELGPELLQESKRLHNLGLSGGFLAIAFGLTLIVLPPPVSRSKLVCKLLVPSLLVAPVAFCDRTFAILGGTLSAVLQAFFYGMQAVSAIGITVSLALIVFSLFQAKKLTR
jgi:hypothetical protein